MRAGFGEFVAAVVDPQVLGVADIHEPVVAGPAVRMDDAIEGDAAANCFAQSVFRDIRDDLGVDAIAPLEHAEDDGLVACAASTFASDPSWPEVGFIDFYFPPEGVLGFAMLGNAAAEFEINRVNRAKADAGQLGRIGGGEVHRKSVNNPPKNLLRDSGTEIIAITYCRHKT